MIFLEEFKVHENPATVFVNWEYALKVCENLDKLADEEDRLPIQGKSAIAILAEYAAIAHRCAWPPAEVGLIVVVCPPSVWFCPNDQKENGLFIEPYIEEQHGTGIQLTGKDDLFDFCSISARRDGWHFAAEMIFAAGSHRHVQN